MRRALRLFPALIVSLLFTALVLGPLLTTVPVSDYLQDVKTKYYVLFHVLFQQDLQLLGVFHEIPIRGSSTPRCGPCTVEFKAYVLIAIIGVLGFFRRGPWWILILAVLSGALLVNSIRNGLPLANNVVALTQDIQIGDAWVKEARAGRLFIVFQPFAAFIVGATLFRLRAWIPLSWVLFSVALVAWIVTVLVWDPQASRILITWLMPYMVLVLAYRTSTVFSLPPALRRDERLGGPALRGSADDPARRCCRGTSSTRRA